MCPYLPSEQWQKSFEQLEILTNKDGQKPNFIFITHSVIWLFFVIKDHFNEYVILEISISKNLSCNKLYFINAHNWKMDLDFLYQFIPPIATGSRGRYHSPVNTPWKHNHCQRAK